MGEEPKQNVIGHNNIQAGRDVNVYPAPQEPRNHHRESPWRNIGWFIGSIAVVLVIVWAIMPRASIGKPFVDQEVFGNDQTRKFWNVHYYEIPILNESYTTTIRVMNFQLTDLQRLEGKDFRPWGNVAPASLAWSRISPREIAPRKRVTASFARIYPPDLQRELGEGDLYSGDVDIPQLRFTVAPWLRKMTSHVEPGIYHFKLTVFFEKAPPAEATFELEWPGKQRESAESIAQEIKIKKL